MANELATGAEITIAEQGNMNTYSANKQAMEKIKSLSDEDFEKAIASFDYDTQTFFRLAREH